ncbi:hypothetical protein KKC65_02585 [Patescibacteria group bacterium]|nr:hypothetical protein [Patescibacteria group bacterium]
MLEYSKEELWSLYKQIPKDLQRATFSEQVGTDIRKICDKNGITDEDLILKITKNVGYVFLGLLSPDKFSEELQRDLKMKKETADQISGGLTNIVFLPLKKSLDILYGIEIKAIKITEPAKKEPAIDIYKEKI